MSDILERIFAAKAKARECDMARESHAALADRAVARVPERRAFARRLRETAAPAIVGEIKRASPSAGLIARNFDPVATARAYEAAGVDAISVITEADHFLGDLAYLDVVRAQTTRPLLRKDFLSTPYEVAQSAAYGADAILLIVAGLTDAALRENIAEAARYDLDVLVEVHDLDELQRALDLGAGLIGINNRNLRTFETDLATTEHLLPKIPSGVSVIAESGVRGAADIRRLLAAGAHGFLIGESLMRAGNPGAVIAEFKAAGARSAVS